MRKPGMAIHSESSFNEGKAIRIVSEKLEEEHTIKTFMKENDRTPNYDGTFELVGEKGAPKKQFIVQIKKVENLFPKGKSKHKGKYVYLLETPFLYYVKEKVTESPAIYFVIDIVTKHIFYLYLSDECLMSLDFEGKYKVQYEFTEEDMLTNIDKFYQKMDCIATERNRKFVKKTPEEIVEIQDAVDYFNELLNHDLKIIKENAFPDVWRFGIASSNTDQIEFTYWTEKGEKIVMTSSNTGLFALYPQYKGQADYGFREYEDFSEQYFSNVDMTGTISYKEYVENSLLKIVYSFCDVPPIEILPTEILMERIYRKSRELNEFLEGDEALTNSKAYRQCILLFGYLGRIVIGQGLTQKEKQFRDRFIKNQTYTGESIDILNFRMWNDLKEDMLAFIATQCESYQEITLPSADVFNIIQTSNVEYFAMCEELAKRSETEIMPIVDYNIVDLYENKIGLEQIKEICKEVFERLPDIYIKGYKKIFNTDKYRFSCKVRYELYDSTGLFHDVSACVHEYTQEEFGKIDIEYQENLSKLFTDTSDTEWKEGFKHILSRNLIEPFIRSETPVYNGFRCWLYQGICNGLGFKCSGLTVNHQDNVKLFGE